MKSWKNESNGILLSGDKCNVPFKFPVTGGNIIQKNYFPLAYYTLIAYSMRVEFKETNVFEKQITGLLSDNAYRALQALLIENPKAGAVIPSGKGLRKLRWAGSGRGKRGGIRVIYYVITDDMLLMILAYAKKRKTDITKDQLKSLVDAVDFLKG